MNGVQVRDGKAVLNWRSIESALYTLVTYTTSDGENQTLEFLQARVKP